MSSPMVSRDDSVDLAARRERRTRFAFEGIISTYHSPLLCEHTIAGGKGCCPEPAVWRVDAHGCERMMMCTEHKDGYISRTAAPFSRQLTVECSLCGKSFTAPADVYTVTAL